MIQGQFGFHGPYWNKLERDSVEPTGLLTLFFGMVSFKTGDNLSEELNTSFLNRIHC